MQVLLSKNSIKFLHHSKVFCIVYTLALVGLSTFFFSHNSWQSITWTFPYFSGAANFENLFDWKISPSDYENVIRTTGSSGDENSYYYYKHQRTEDLVENTVNNYGYLLIVLLSKKLFPFLGDLQGVVWFQLIFHTITSLFIVSLVFERLVLRYGVILLYAANPLVIYFTTFPFYYFWLCVPSIIFSVVMIKPNWNLWWIYAALPFLLLSLYIRPTTLFLCGWIFLTIFLLTKARNKLLIFLPSIVIFTVVIYFLFGSSSGSPWHTMYVGIGGYQNNVGVVDLADGRGYEYYYEKTGKRIDTNPISGNWNNLETRNEYMLILKNRYLEILNEEPYLLLKNALLNLLKVFSIGYIDDRPQLNWVTTTIGAIVLAFLIYCHQFLWITAIFASAISFAWYFPPIPAYNFAAYLLLVMGALCGIEKIIEKFTHKNSS